MAEFVVSDNITTIQIPDLINGNNYKFRVKTRNLAGFSDYTEWVTNIIPYGVPAKPTLTSATPGDTKVTLLISLGNNNGRTIDKIKVKVDNSATDLEFLGTGSNPTFTIVNNQITLEITGLTNSQSYSFAVKAGNLAGYSVISDTISDVIPFGKPLAPTITTITPGNTIANLIVTLGDNNGRNITQLMLSRTDITNNTAAVEIPISSITINEDNTVNVQATGLTNGNNYSFKVKAYNIAGYGPYSEPSTTIPRTIPSKPTIVSILENDSFLFINTNPPSSNGGNLVTKYKAHATYLNTYSFEEEFELGTNESDLYQINSSFYYFKLFNETGLANGLTYSIKIAAYNEAGYSDWSNSLSGTPRTIPNPPTLDSVVSGNQQLTVSFTAPQDNGGSDITKYKIYNGSTLLKDNISSSSSSTIITGLTNGTTYNISVVAVNVAGESIKSNIINGTPKTVPLAPTLTSLLAGNGQITINFTAPSNNGGTSIIKYKVYNGNDMVLDNISASSTSTTITGLTNGTSYTFTITAFNEVGESTKSNSLSEIPKTIPTSPTNITITPDNQKLIINFNPPSSNGGSSIIDYTILATYLNNGVSNTISEVFTPSGSAPYTYNFINLTNGVPYSIVIQARNSVSLGNQSEPISRTPRTIPGKPTDISVLPDNQKLTVSFTAPQDNGGSVITKYKIYDGLTLLKDNISPVSSSVEISELTNGTTYNLTVVAVNEAGESSKSDSVSGIPRTIPDAPTDISVENDNTKLIISFKAPLNNGGNEVNKYKVLVITSSQTQPSSKEYLVSSLTFTNNIFTAEYTSLINGTTYNVTVQAGNEAGYSIESSPSVSGKPRTIPNAPTDISVDVSLASSQAIVSFKAPLVNGGAEITKYKIIATDGTNNISKELTLDNLTLNNSIYSGIIDGLTNGTSYTFKVQAYNEAGYGVLSSSSSSVIPYGVPNAPIIGDVVVNNRVFSIPFSTPNSNGRSITKYKLIAFIVSKVNNENSYTQFSSKEIEVSNITNNTLSYSGLSPNVKYSFTLQAFNIRGYSSESEYSDIEEFLPTYPNLPTGGIQEIFIPNENALKYRISFTGAVETNPPITKYRIYQKDTIDSAIDLEMDEDFIRLPSDDLSFEVELSATTNKNTYWRIFTENIDGISQENGQPISFLIIFNKLTNLDKILDIVNKEDYNELFPTVHSKKLYIRNVVKPILVNGGIVKYSNISKFFQKSLYSTAGIPENLQTFMTLLGSSTSQITNISSLVTANKVAYLNILPNDTIKFKTRNDGPTYTIDNSIHNSLTNDLEQFTISTTTPSINSSDFLVSNSFTEGFRFDEIRIVMVGGVGITTDIPNTSTFDATSISDTKVKLDWTIASAPITYFSIHISADSSNIDTEPELLNTGNPISLINSSEYIISNFSNLKSYELRVASNLNTINIGGFSRNSSISFNIRAVNTDTKLISLPSHIETITTFNIPSSPTNISALAGNQSATITYSLSTNNGGTSITSYKAVSTPGGKIGTSNGSSISVTGLTNGTSYTFTVVAINSVGESVLSTNSNAVIPFGVPLKPTINGVLAGEGKVTISVSLQNNGRTITKLQVIKDNDTNNPTEITPSIVNNIASFDITGLTNGQTYSFKVRAFNEAGWSEYSDSVNSSSRTRPNPPNLISVQPDNKKLTISWEEPDFNGGSVITGYKIYNGNSVLLDNILPTSLSSSILELLNGTNYSISVVAINIVGESIKSNIIIGKPRTIPDEPILTNLEPDNQQVTVFFRPPLNNGGDDITKYKIVVTESISSEPVVENEYTISDLNYVEEDEIYNKIITGLTNGTEYEFKVFAKNSAGLGPENILDVDVVSFSIPRTVPNAPSNILVENGDKLLTVSFETPDNNGAVITEYKIKATFNTSQIVEQIFTLNEEQFSLISHSFEFTGTSELTNGTLYSIVVLASNIAGYSVESSPAINGKPRTIPNAPTDISVDVSLASSQATVSFKAPIVNGGANITKYKITATDGNNNITEEYPLDDLTLSNSVYSGILDGLTNGTSYTFKVQAYNEAGYSDFSSSSSSVIPYGVPNAPIIGNVTVNNRVFSIPFTVPNNNGRVITGYKVSAYIEQEENGVKVNEFDSEKEIGITENPILYSGLNPNVKYVFRIIATNIRGDSEYSNYSNSVLFLPTFPSLPTNINIDLVPTLDALKYKVSFTAGENVDDYLVYKVNSLTEIVDTNIEPLITTTNTFFEITMTTLQDNSKTYYRIFTRNIDGISNNSGVKISVPVVYNPFTNLDTIIDKLGSLHPTRHNKKVYIRDVVTPLVSFTKDKIKYSNIGKFISHSIFNANNISNNLEVHMSLAKHSTSTVNDLSTVWGRNKVVYFNVVPLDTIKFSNGSKIYTINNTVHNSSTNELEKFSLSVDGLVSKEFTVNQLGNEGFRYDNLRVVLGGGIGLTEEIAVPTNLLATTLSNTSIKLNWDYSYTLSYFIIKISTDYTKLETSPIILNSGNIINENYIINNFIVGSNYELRVNKDLRTINISGFPAGTIINFNVRASDSETLQTSLPTSNVSSKTFSKPGLPKNIEVVPNDKKLVVSFNSPDDNGGTPITNYRVLINPGARTTIGNSPITITGLTNGQTYSVQVNAINLVGNGSYSSAISSMPFGTPLKPLINVQEQDSKLRVEVSGAYNGREINKIIVSINGEEQEITEFETDSNGNIVVYLEGLVNGDSYDVGVKVVDIDNNESESSELSTNNIPYGIPLKPIINVEEQDSKLRVEVNGGYNGREITKIIVIINGEEQEITEFEIDSEGKIIVILEGLVNGESYDIGIKVVDSENNESESSIVSSDNVPFGVPNKPVIKGIEIKDEEVRIRLEVDNNGRGTGKVIVEINGEEQEITDFEVDENGEIIVIVGGLINGEEYDIRVKVVNEEGLGGDFEEINGKIVTYGLPGKPIINETENNNGTLILKFSVEENGRPVEKILVEVNGEEREIEDFIVENGEIIVNIEDLDIGIENNLRVKVVNTEGLIGSYSDIKKIIVSRQPGPPKILNIEKDNNKILVSFEEPEDNGGDNISGYMLIAYIEGVESGRVESNINPIEMAGLYPGIEYKFKLVAKNSNGYGRESEISGGIVVESNLGPEYPKIESNGIRLEKLAVKYDIKLIPGENVKEYIIRKSFTPEGTYELLLETENTFIEDEIDINIPVFYKIFTKGMDNIILPEPIMVVYKPFKRLDEIIEKIETETFETRNNKKIFMREIIRPKVGYTSDEIKYSNLEKFIEKSIFTGLNIPKNLKTHMILAAKSETEIIDISDKWINNTISYFNIIDSDIIRFKKDDSGTIYRINNVKGNNITGELESFNMNIEGDITKTKEFKVTEFDLINGFKYDNMVIPVVGGVGVMPFIQPITEPPSDFIPCFTEDTIVLTPSGYKNIIDLRKGDLVLTDDNREVEIEYIYSFSVKGSNKTYPYYIPKDYFRTGVPGKRTFLSGGHCIKVDYRWAYPMGLGLGRIRSKDIVYYHIKLPDYSTDNLVINNGLVVESYGIGYGVTFDKDKKNKKYLINRKVYPKLNSLTK